MKVKALVLASVFALIGVTFGFAQMNNMPRMYIPFSFTVGGKVLPAGDYDFVRDALDTAIRVVSVKGGPSSDVTVKTRLGAEIHTTANDSHIVFDKVGEVYTFSELWVPGTDGYLVNIIKEKHTHRTINVPM
jgi:hypothetical protein